VNSDRSPLLVTLVVTSALLTAAAPFASAQQGETVTLHEAALRNNIEALQRHIDAGTDLDKPDARGNTALGRASASGRTEAMDLLIKSGANVNAPSAGVPPLVLVTLQRRLDLVTLLLDNGADVNGKDDAGRTALIVAAENALFEAVELLVGKGADVNASDKRGTTPLSAASRARRTEIVDFLKSHGAKEPVIGYDRDPYGMAGMPPGTAVPPGAAAPLQATTAQASVLADPNAIREKIAEHAGLAEALAALDTQAASIERSWASRRSDNRTTLIRAVVKQFASEMALVTKIATEEKATATIAATAELVAKRKARYDLIGSDLRAARRLAQQEARAMSGRGRGRGSARAGRSATPGYSDPAQMGDPYGAPPQRRSSRSTATEEVPEEPLDPEAVRQADAWLAASPEDKRGLLAAVHELNLLEYDALRQVAADEEAEKTATAIEGLMLARQGRVDRVLAKMAAEDERLQRMAERYGTTPGTTPGAPRTRRGRRSP
jgi:hypothetical protein